MLSNMGRVWLRFKTNLLLAGDVQGKRLVYGQFVWFLVRI